MSTYDSVNDEFGTQSTHESLHQLTKLKKPKSSFKSNK